MAEKQPGCEPLCDKGEQTDLDSDTPLSDQLERLRVACNQERTPAYGDALALCRKLERRSKPAPTEDELRAIFERTHKDSYGFKRSRRGTYMNPAVARDWKNFLAGAAVAAGTGAVKEWRSLSAQSD